MAVLFFPFSFISISFQCHCIRKSLYTPLDRVERVRVEFIAQLTIATVYSMITSNIDNTLKKTGINVNNITTMSTINKRTKKEN